MGICYSYCLNKDANIHAVINPLDETSKSLCEYEIVLKIPHGTTCFHANESTSFEWKCNEDVNKVLKNLYKDLHLEHWIVYNDETPIKTISTGAHAKGIIAWNNRVVTWLIHSVPKFPTEFNGTNEFPEINHSELEYGQSFIFIKIDIEHLENIMKQLFIMHPAIYITNVNCDEYRKNYKHETSNIYKINNKLYHATK